MGIDGPFLIGIGSIPWLIEWWVALWSLGSLGRCHRLPLDDLLGDQIRTANLTDTELRFLIEILGARPRGLSAKASESNASSIWWLGVVKTVKYIQKLIMVMSGKKTWPQRLFPFSLCISRHSPWIGRKRVRLWIEHPGLLVVALFFGAVVNLKVSFNVALCEAQLRC